MSVLPLSDFRSFYIQHHNQVDVYQCLIDWIEEPGCSWNEQQIRVNVVGKIREFLSNKDEQKEGLLDLSDLGLKSLPSILQNEAIISKLTRFNLSKNNFEKLPDFICDFRLLYSLDLSDNFKLQSLPDSFGKLNSLRLLDLTQALKEKEDLLPELRLPASFGELKLEELMISGYHMQAIPDVILRINSMKTLMIINTDLEEIPDELPERMSNLVELSLGYNDIETVPDNINRLDKLKELDLSGNCIDEFPESIFDLKDCTIICEELEVSVEQVEAIAEKMDQLNYTGPSFDDLDGLDYFLLSEFDSSASDSSDSESESAVKEDTRKRKKAQHDPTRYKS